MAAVLKKYIPEINIAFLGKSYTKAIINTCEFVDEFIDIEDFLNREVKINNKPFEAIIHVFPQKKIAFRSLKAGIPLRIGTTNRIYHWFTCNKLVKLGRKNSPLHEAQLNLELLKALKLPTLFSLQQLRSVRMFGLSRLEPLDYQFAKLIEKNKYNLILHPRSKGSGREWPLNNFIALIQILDPVRYAIHISGTDEERKTLQPLFDAAGDKIIDATGIPLGQFISFINQCDGLLASSTGPLHIAAALGKDALGIFPPLPTANPSRWQPLGPRAKSFVLNKDCRDCQNKKISCHCVAEILPPVIKAELDQITNAIYAQQ